MTDEPRSHPFRHSHQDVEAADRIPDTPQTRAPAYRLAFTDNDFMCREELRPVRLQLELLKPQMIMDERGIQSTIVLMGSARIPAKGEEKGRATDALAGWYEEARKLARLITERSMDSYGRENVIVTGGGPGIMEAGNRGAHEAGGHSIGLNIVLPH
ncbi:MAG: lysine decarboxylase, partial [Rhodobacteraceae bacterium]|nr:lysine decarboxylase [Paracoccaceae bacterium]